MSHIRIKPALYAPQTYYPSIVAEMVRSDWAPLCNTLVTGMSESFNKCMMEAFTAALRQRFPKAARYVPDCIKHASEECLAAALQHVSALLAINENPYTQVLNPHYLYITHLVNPPSLYRTRINPLSYTQNHYLYENINKK
jgi:hypothetical protein